MVPEVAHIYGLYDPRIPDVIWYVGKTNNQYNRIQYYRKEKRWHSPVFKWFRRLQAEGSEPKLRVLETCPFREWKDRERSVITLHRKKNLLLLNVLCGGNGTDVKGKKEFCDVCGVKRVQLYPSDSSLRCPICRKEERTDYYKQYYQNHKDEQSSVHKFYYLANKEKIDMEVKTKKRNRIAAGLCVRCGRSPAQEGRRSCNPCLKIQADNAQAHRDFQRNQELKISFC